MHSKNYFNKNRCRVCSKIFCCCKCRIKHEENYHKINNLCDICLYGKIFIVTPSEELLDHIKSVHWPLHCTYCKTVFTTVEEMLTNNVCQIGTHSLNQLKLLEQPIKIATSTPMQRNNNNECLEEIVPKIITPVDHYNCKREIVNTINVVSETVKASPLVKHKVTFCQSVKEHSCEIIENDKDLIQSTPKNENQINKITGNNMISGLKSDKIFNSEEFNKEISVEVTVWESAVEEKYEKKKKQIITYPTNNEINVALFKKSGRLWSSMTHILKNVVEIFLKATPAQSQEFQQLNTSIKRTKPDDDQNDICPRIKKMKLTDLRCRRPIGNHCSHFQYYGYQKQVADKSTQTDEIF